MSVLSHNFMYFILRLLLSLLPYCYLLRSLYMSSHLLLSNHLVVRYSHFMLMLTISFHSYMPLLLLYMLVSTYRFLSMLLLYLPLYRHLLVLLHMCLFMIGSHLVCMLHYYYLYYNFTYFTDSSLSLLLLHNFMPMRYLTSSNPPSSHYFIHFHVL